MRFVAIFILLLLGGWAPHGLAPTAVGPPTLISRSLAGSSPAVTNALLTWNGAAASIDSNQSLTSCSITAGNSAGNFACAASGAGVNISITSTGAANLTGGSDDVAFTLTVTGTNGNGTSAAVSVPIDVYADGSAGAPGGSANAAALMSNGAAGGTGTSYSFVPPWKVAGKDYRTGYDTTIGALTDPNTGGFPACVTSATGHVVTIGGNGPCTIQKYDFSLENGWNIVINSGCSTGTVTIKNNNFLIGSNFGPTGIYIISSTGACNVDLENNVIDGNGCTYTNLAALVSFNGGTVTAKYNQFLNSPQHGINLGHSGSGNSFVSAYNYYRVFGYGTNNHVDPFIFNGTGSFTTATSKFDVIVEPGKNGDPSIVGNCVANTAIGGGTGGMTAAEYFAPSGTIANPATSYDTIIASSNGAVMVSKIVEANSGTVTGQVITNNWYDVSGILSVGVPYNLTNSSSPTISGNKLLTNGHSCDANNSCS
jgi:hypothetical protein